VTAIATVSVHPSAVRRGPAAVVLALLIALAGAILPAVAPALPLPAFITPAAALAADDIEIRTSARYTVDPEARAVRVLVEVTAVNRKPDQVTAGGVTRFFYDGVNLGVQPEARAFRATRDGERLRVRAADRPGYRLVTVLFGQKLYFGESAKLRLTFRLPGGRPRSQSDVRVDPAFTTFTAWAFGDSGRVRIEIPGEFRVETAGEELTPEHGAGGLQAWSASTGDPRSWYALVTATNDAALTSDRLVLEDGEDVVIRAWPDDDRWRSRVRVLLRDGLPALVELIGLPWPVEGSLEVTEVHTPLLEGYAGFYDPATDRITISEDLDDLTIIHEASHAWFNGSLFTERWITEGLADEFAARVLQAEDRGYPGPDRVVRRDPAAFALNDWPPPAAIRDQEAGDREAYGYAASWTLVRRIIARVGEEGMRRVLTAAAAGTTAYPGEGDPERSRLPNDWRRFLDLAEQAAGATGAVPDDGGRSIAELVELWALDDAEAAVLPARQVALAAYATLLERGGTWAPPAAVRLALDEWDFADVGDVIDLGAGILATRDAIDALAVSEGLVADPGLEADYQDAESEAEMNVVAEEASRSLDVLEAIVAAREAAAVPRDWITDLGLDGTDPGAAVEAAGVAWEAGDLDGAAAGAAGVVATLAAAPEGGRSRAILAAVAAAILVVLLLVALGWIAMRTRRGPARALATLPATPLVTPTGTTEGTPAATAPEPDRPYATLPRDRSPAEPPGGPASGDEGANRS